VAGSYVIFGNRRTYMPPFVNERHGTPPFWSCTFASLLNGANVGFLGTKPAVFDEVLALAKASLDDDLTNGAQTTHMVTAMRRLYGKRIVMEDVSSDEAKRRLQNGYALVAGVTAPKLPNHYRRWAPSLQKGHRIVLLGWRVRNGVGETQVLDPIARADEKYLGEPIPWDAVTAAWWKSQQVWFFEGQFVPAARAPAAVAGDAHPSPAASTGPRVIRRFAPARHFSVDAGTLVRAYSMNHPGVVAKQLRFNKASGAAFDALVAMPARRGGEDRHFLRVFNGAFADLCIRSRAPGITADTRP
jgi:hypothetical protein